MADINLNFNEKELMAAAKQLQAAAKAIQNAFKKAGGPIKRDLENLKKVAGATKKVAGEKKKLTALQKEEIRQLKRLETLQARNALARSKTAKEIIKQEKALRAVNRELRTGSKNTASWGKALGSFQFKFNALGNIAANVTSSISRSVNRAMRAAIKTVVDFDKALADVKATTGSTTKEINQLAASAKQLGGITKFTATQVLGLQKAYAKLGFSTKEILNAQAATLDLAAAVDADLARSAEVAGITLRQFGLDATETQRVVDVMGKSFTTSALDMEKFAESMKFVGPAARASGLSLEETTARLAQLADAGISGSMAGTSFRQILISMGVAGKDVNERIKELAESNLDLAGASKEVQRRAATALLVLKEGAGTVDDFTEALNKASGTVRDMALIQLDTLAGKATLVKSAWEKMILTFIDTENGLGGIKNAFDTIILTLDALAIKAEHGFTFSTSLGIAKAVTDANEYIDHIERSNKQLDMLLGGFDKIGGWMKELGQDLWDQMFPKASSPVEELESVEDVVKRLMKIFNEERFTEDDNWFWNIGGALDTSVGDEVITNLTDILDIRREIELDAMKQQLEDVEVTEDKKLEILQTGLR
ncbi:MAG: phage tail tape measure protein, partial [Dehalococcoidia bacterium]